MTDIEEKYEPIIDVEDGGKVFHRRTESVCNWYDIYLDDDISDSSNYSDICNLLRTIKKTDFVDVYLSNFGGSCHGCVSLINAVEDCKAFVAMYVTAPCYSAGATLAIAGDGLWMYPNTFLMFHNYSAISMGKGHELELDTKHTKKWIHGYFDDIHRPFLTKPECRRITEDKDLYIHVDDPTVEKRMERHFDDQKKKRKRPYEGNF